MLSAYAGSIYQSQLEGAIARLAERLPEQTWVDLQELAQQNVLVRAGAELNLNPGIWQQLEQACKERRQVQIQYLVVLQKDFMNGKLLGKEASNYAEIPKSWWMKEICPIKSFSTPRTLVFPNHIHRFVSSQCSSRCVE
jgi:hypothetical protein